jgi:glutamine cyclotransferase
MKQIVPHIGSVSSMQYFEGMFQSTGLLSHACENRLFQKRVSMLFILFLLSVFAWPTEPTFAVNHTVPTESYRVVHTYPHDTSAFTQGLVFINGMLYEGTGLNGRSSIRMVDLATGRVLQQHDLPEKYFGEGLTDWKNNLIELTWHSHVGFVYDRFSFRLLRTFTFSEEGWGLTHDSRHLILSDGTSVLHLLDPSTFQQVGQITVTDDGKPVLNLNELEYIHGEIYANVWQTDRIARISPKTGRVLAWADLTGLRLAVDNQDGNAVLNGIAYDSQHDRLFVTGKLWPKLFEIQLVSSVTHSQ